IGILGVISNSLSLSAGNNFKQAGNDINIVSGYMVASLAILALMEHHGGLRTSSVQPNLLADFARLGEQHPKFSSFTSRYLDTVRPASPSGMTRRQELIRYWRDAKVLTVDVNRESTLQKVAAQGDAHHWWDETIRLINNRIFMLYDLRAVVRGSNVGF